jgi:hypothetical protein
MLQHPKVGRLTDRQIRLWVGLITQADDEGRLVADAGQLRLLVFGYFPDVSEGNVNEALEAIARVGLIQLYNVDDVRYAWIVGWKAHQKIDRKTLSRLPPGPLPSPRRVFDEPSFRIGSRIRSRIRSRIKSRIKDRSGREGNGSSGNYRGATHSELPEGLRQRTSANRPSQRYVREDRQ